MSLEDRTEIASVVQETYALTGRVLSTDAVVAGEVVLRPEVIDQLMSAEIGPLVSDAEMLSLLRTAYFDLVETVIRLQEELLGPSGDDHDEGLGGVGLTQAGRRVKVRGFRRALERLFDSRSVDGRRKWVKKAYDWVEHRCRKPDRRASRRCTRGSLSRT